MWRFRCELEAGEVDKARSAAGRFREIVTRSPLPYHAWYADLFDGVLALIGGDFERAARFAGNIDPMATTQGVQARVNAVTLTQEIEIARGKACTPASAEALHRLHDTIDETMGLGWMVRAHLFALTRQPVDVYRELDNAIPHALPSVAGEDWFILMASLAAAAILTGSSRHAAQLFERLEPYSGQWIVIANGAGCRGPVSSFLCGLAAVAGMPGAAAAYRAQAIAAIEKAGASGLSFWPRLRPLQPGVPRGEREAGLTARESEVLALLARGHSNQEIAEQLVLSIRTVQRHVENLYGRLDVHNRAQVVIEAVRRGLIDPSDTPE
jgi:DNA-binding CsgD family transcriptional regulator